MSKLLAPMILMVSLTASASPWFHGTPQYADEASRKLADEVITAHGGMDAMAAAESLQFNFFTKALGNPSPFYSVESVNLENGSAYLEWPFFDAAIAWDRETVWSHQWPVPLPPGFFVRLTSSFLTLPWLMFSDDANIGPVTTGRLPDDDTDYEVLRITFDSRSPSIPGTFYELFVDPEHGVMKAIRFDINHPGMAANPNQVLGPNVHVFGEYNNVNGLIFPTFYKTYGRGGTPGPNNAYHFVWNIRLDQPFDKQRLTAPDGAETDELSVEWWQSESMPKR